MADPYLVLADLTNSFDPTLIVRLFDDDADGVPDPGPLATVLNRASRWVDWGLKPTYTGPLPLTTAQVSELVKETALHFAMAFAYDRKPGFIKTDDDKSQRKMHFDTASKLVKDAAVGLIQMPETTPARGPVLTGGLVLSGGPQFTVVDGVSNTGDF